jgi:hypothetical protein
MKTAVRINAFYHGGAAGVNAQGVKVPGAFERFAPAARKQQNYGKGCEKQKKSFFRFQPATSSNMPCAKKRAPLP